MISHFQLVFCVVCFQTRALVDQAAQFDNCERLSPCSWLLTCHFGYFSLFCCILVCGNVRRGDKRGGCHYILCWAMPKLSLSSESPQDFWKLVQSWAGSDATYCLAENALDWLFSWLAVLVWAMKWQWVAFRKLFQPTLSSCTLLCGSVCFVHLGWNLFQLRSWLYLFFVSVIEGSGSDLLCWVIHSFCLLLLLCWQLHLGECSFSWA